METAKNILHLAHHRSKKRIRDFGEVFTPEKYVHQMLDMLDKSIWADTNIVFFEPTCGHGNFVVAVVKRRLKAFLKKAKRKSIKKPYCYAVANTLNNLWAIDIDSNNIELCRDRVCQLVFDFLWDFEKNRFSFESFIKQNKDFLTHVLCCIQWQIQENEALSCLEKDPAKAKEAGNKTAVSRKWLKTNNPRPINFEQTWCEYFKFRKSEDITPIEYVKNLKFLNSLVSNKLKVEKGSKNRKISFVMEKSFKMEKNPSGSGFFRKTA